MIEGGSINYWWLKIFSNIFCCTISAKQSDCSEKCRLTLLLIKQFPEAVKECAVCLSNCFMGCRISVLSWEQVFKNYLSHVVDA